MKSSVVRDRRVRSTIERYEVVRRVLKYLQRQGPRLEKENQNSLYPMEVSARLASLPRDSSATRATRYCAYTGRKGGIVKTERRSRRRFKQYAMAGKIPGVRPASW